VTGGFRQRVLTALTWSTSGEIAAQAIRFAFGIALARLLSPRDFGLMAMLTVVVQFAVGNADLGFEEALVQRARLHSGMTSQRSPNSVPREC
jgi:lipopolysaccharide exporter